MAKDLTTLKTQATTIANETAEGANTAARVGGAIGDIVDWLKENGSTGGSSSGGGSLTSGSVTTDKIKDGAVTTSKIATNAVTEDKLSATLQERLNNLSSGSGDIATGAVTTEKIASNAVTTDKLAKDIQDRLSQIVKHYKYEGVVVTGSSVPTGTGNAFVIAQTEGVYTNFKGANGSSLTVSASNTDYTDWVAILKTDSSGSRAFWTVEYICVHVGIKNGSVTSEKLADGAVATSNIKNNSVSIEKLSSDVQNKLNSSGGSSISSVKDLPEYQNNALVIPAINLTSTLSIWAIMQDKNSVNALILRFDNGYIRHVTEGNYTEQFDLPVYFTQGYTQSSDLRLKTVICQDAYIELDVMANAPLITYNYNNDTNKTIHSGTTAQYWREKTGHVFVRDIPTDNETYLGLETDNLSLTIGLSLARYLTETNNKIKELEERIKELENKQTE